MSMCVDDVFARVSADLRSAEIPFATAFDAQGRRFLLVERFHAFRMASWFRQYPHGKEIYGLTGKPRKSSPASDTDSGLLTGTGVHFPEEKTVIAFCEHRPDGRWHTEIKEVPLPRLWAPLPGQNPFSGGRFAAEEAIAFLPDGSGFMPPVSVDLPPPEAVDVVYTWVDSDDPKWGEKKRRFGAFPAVRSADNAYRYMSRNELLYSMRSLRMHAPWVRNIYIVTDDQRPNWLRETSNVRVVDHREIFEDVSMLPTFNSHAIEANLHRIPGLSECFLYMNDDFFLGADVAVSHFFDAQGRSLVYPTRVNIIDPLMPQELRVPTDLAGYNMQDILLRDFGFVPIRKLLHAPYALRKSILEEISSRYEQEVKGTSAARTRSITDLAIPSMFYHYYAWATGRAVLRQPGIASYKYFDTGRKDARAAVDLIKDRKPHFICANVTLHEELGFNEQERLLSSLYEMFPERCDFENSAEGH